VLTFPIVFSDSRGFSRSTIYHINWGGILIRQFPRQKNRLAENIFEARLKGFEKFLKTTSILAFSTLIYTFFYSIPDYI
jgi:hypothetical protein